jgi:phage portal protein BeeE
MGGNENGQPDNKALLKTLELNKTLLDGVSKALKSSYAVNGVIKYNTLMDDGTMDKNIKALEDHLKNSESGFLPMDIKGEFIPLKNEIQLVDADTLKFIDEKILRHFGVPLPILTGDYTKAQYEAFYQKTLEPLIISISQAFTMALFTDREKAFGNKVQFYPHELIFMNTSQKIALFDLLTDSASCYKNEVRVAFGLRPLRELGGQLAMSSNKTNAENNKTGAMDEPDEEQQMQPQEEVINIDVQEDQNNE